MLARETLEQFLNDVASEAPSPGSGAAAATALAIAIACLRKAVAISIRHARGNLLHLSAADRLTLLMRSALDAAEQDSHDSSELLSAEHAKDDRRASDMIAKLTSLARSVEAICWQTRAEANNLASIIRPNMRNDVLAARTLSEAAAEITRANGAENSALHHRQA